MVDKIPDFKRQSVADSVSVKETPVVDENQAIQPVASGQNAQAAFAGTSAAFDNLGALGASVASNSAQQRAAQQAIMDAQHPDGKEPFPGFTSADKAYVQTYNQQSMNVLTHQGQVDLDNAYNELSKNPTPGALLEYQKQGQQTIQNLSQLGTDSNRFDVTRSLENSYQSRFNNLSNAVTARIKADQLSNYNASYNQALDNQINYGQQGMFDALSETTKNAIAATENAYANRSINAEVRQARIQSLKIGERTGKLLNGLTQAESKNEGDRFLADFANYNPSDLSVTDKEVIGESLRKHLGAVRSLKAGQQQVDYTHALMDVDADKITASSMEDYRTSLNEQQFANLQKAYQDRQIEIQKSQKSLVDIKENSSNAALLASISDSDFNKGFSQLVANSTPLSEDPIINQAYLTAPIKRNNPVVTKVLEQAIAYGTPEQALSAASAVTYLLNTNSGVSVQTMDRQARSIGSLYQLYSTDTTKTPQENLERAREQVLKTDPETQETRLKLLRDRLGAGGVTTSSIKNKIRSDLSEHTYFGLGREQTVIPDSATAAYMSALTSYSINGLGYAEASKQASNDVALAYPLTNINGHPERMKYSDRMPFGDDVTKNVESKQLSMQYIAATNKESRESNKAVVQKLDYIPETGQMSVNGVPRDIFVKSDYRTDLAKGKAWVLYYVDDKGLQVNLTDPRSPDGVARWIP